MMMSISMGKNPLEQKMCRGKNMVNGSKFEYE